MIKRTMAVGTMTVVAMAVGARSTAGAQGLPPAPAEMEAVAWLAGDWEGSGWIEYSPGQRAEFTGRERVEARMGGRLVVLEGEFTAWMGPQAGDVPVHQALGVISYDERGDRYQFRTYTARGGHGDARPMEVGDGRLVWGYDDPTMGSVRYTMTRTETGAWHEVGHASRDDGETWHHFFEMTLQPMGPATAVGGSR